MNSDTLPVMLGTLVLYFAGLAYVVVVAVLLPMALWAVIDLGERYTPCTCAQVEAAAAPAEPVEAALLMEPP